MSEMRWYTLQVYSGMEKKAAQILRDRIRLNPDVASFFGEVLVPSEEVVELRDNKKRKVEKKFYPGYMMVQMIANDVSRALVKNTSHIFGFLGGDERPSPLPEKEIERILRRLSVAKLEDDKVRVNFEVGEYVRIINGPFSDFNGMIDEINRSKNSVMVLISVFGRQTPVELHFHQIMKV